MANELTLKQARDKANRCKRELAEAKQEAARDLARYVEEINESQKTIDQLIVVQEKLTTRLESSSLCLETARSLLASAESTLATVTAGLKQTADGVWIVPKLKVYWQAKGEVFEGVVNTIGPGGDQMIMNSDGVLIGVGADLYTSPAEPHRLAIMFLESKLTEARMAAKKSEND